MTVENSHSATDVGQKLLARPFQMLIGGELSGGATTRPVIDPATGGPIAQSPIAGVSEVDRAVRAAKQAFRTWRNTTPEERAAVVHSMITVIEAHSEELATLVTLESGKMLAEARAEAMWASAWGRHFAAQRLDPAILQADDHGRVEMRWQPLGVVAAVVPWNFPLHEALYKVFPLIMAGNTVVLKPAPTTPLSVMRLGELVADIVPAGVLNILGDAGDVGPVLVAHPDVAGITFTGSTAAGKSVMGVAAEGIKRVTLELGGNDAAIVLGDVDVEQAVPGLFGGAYYYMGQVCACIKRFYVHSSIYDEVCDRMAAIAESTRLGSGLEPESEMGPVQNAEQFERSKKWLALAHGDGNVVAGGAVVDRPAYFVRPTVVRDIGDQSQLVQEETFAPIRPIMRFDNIEDAVQRANASPYGLGGSVEQRSGARRVHRSTVGMRIGMDQPSRGAEPERALRRA